MISSTCRFVLILCCCLSRTAIAAPPLLSDSLIFQEIDRIELRASNYTRKGDFLSASREYRAIEALAASRWNEKHYEVQDARIDRAECDSWMSRSESARADYVRIDNLLLRGMLMWRSDDLTGALDKLVEARQAIDSHDWSDSKLGFNVYRQLATRYQLVGDSQSASSLFKRACEIGERLYRTPHPITIASRISFAATQADTCEIYQVEEELRSALKDIGAFRKDNPSDAFCLEVERAGCLLLGAVLVAFRDDEWETFVRRGIELYDDEPSATPHNQVDAEMFRAKLHVQRAEYALAKSAANRAIQLINDNADEFASPKEFRRFFDMAKIFTRIGDLDNARLMMLKGDDYISSIATLPHQPLRSLDSRRALIAYKEGRLKEADELFRKSLDWIQSTSGERHPNLLELIEIYRVVKKSLGDTESERRLAAMENAILKDIEAYKQLRDGGK